MKLVKIVCITALAILLASSAWTADKGARIATISEINGAVEVQSVQGGAWIPATVGMNLTQGDSIRTKASSWAILNIDGNAQTATVEVKQNATLKMAMLLKDEKAGSQTTLLDLSLGEILIKAKKLHSEKSKFEVKTPTSIVGVRGTTFSVSVEAVE